MHRSGLAFPGSKEMDPWQSRHPAFNDILHPRDHYGRLIVTLYDISFVILPECHTEANRQHCLKGTLDAVRYADRIIAVSNSGKNDLVKYFDADPEKVVVTPLAAKDIFSPRGVEERCRVLEKYGIQGDFIFSLGSFEPRKISKLSSGLT